MGIDIDGRVTARSSVGLIEERPLWPAWSALRRLCAARDFHLSTEKISRSRLFLAPAIVAVLFSLFWLRPATAQSLLSKPCQDIKEAIVVATEASVLEGRDGDVIFQHPLVRSMRLSCPSTGDKGVVIEAQSREPSLPWYGFVGLVGEALTGAKRERVYTAVQKCLKSAGANESFQIPHTSALGATIACHVHSTNLPATYVQIWGE